MNKLHPNSIRKILKDNGFSMSKKYSNGRIKGMVSSNGDISLSQWDDNNVSISSRKGNLDNVIKLLKNNDFKISIVNHPSGISSNVLISR